MVEALKIKLLPDQRLVIPGRTDDAEAYNLFLLGRQFHDRTDPASWQRAIDAFRGAIALDPDYAAAYAGLSGALGRLSDSEGNPDGPGPILEPAETAIRLAPDLADGYVARGEVRITFRLDVPGGRADLEKALALNPSDSIVQITFGRLMIALGRLPDAIAAARKATELDPLTATSGRIWLMLTIASLVPPSPRSSPRACA
jgi:tetratricopeptide (TPR) repeat protein